MWPLGIVLHMIPLLRRRSVRATVPARITAAALLGSAATVASLVATDILPVPTWALNGVDVASYQHPGNRAIDWTAVKASGQEFAFIKATEGTGYINPFYSSDSFKAQEAGVTPGSYHFARPGFGNARAQADYYAAALATGPQPSLPPVLDLEVNGGLNPTQLQNWVRDWVDQIKIKTGRDPIIYTYYNFWINDMGNTTEFSQYPLWLAYYSSTLPSRLPGGWKSVTFWQYSSTGNVNGIQGNVDMNEYYGSDAQLKALADDSPSGTLVGAISDALTPVRDAAGNEANIANGVEHVTGVDIPLTTDFLMLLLGIAGGRIDPSALLDQGAALLQAGASPDGSVAAIGGQRAVGSVVLAQKYLPAITALAQALKEMNANGGKLPVDALMTLAGSSGNLPVSQLLGLLQTFGGTQDWSAKLNNGQVPTDPHALKELADAVAGVKPAPAGTPLPPAAVDAALSSLSQGAQTPSPTH